MVWAVMFQGITVFVFIIIFCNDKHNQAIVSRKKRFLYSTLLFIGTDFLLRLFLVKESQILILFNIFGLSVPLLNILDVIKGAGFLSIFLYFVILPIYLFLHFPSFLIFWIQFSKNKKIKIKTTVLYVLWCAITIWLCLSFPTREQRAAQLQEMMEKRQNLEVMQKVENSDQKENTEQVPQKQ